MTLLDRALEKSENLFSDGEFITKLSSLVSLVTDSKNSISNDDQKAEIEKNRECDFSLSITSKIID